MVSGFWIDNSSPGPSFPKSLTSNILCQVWLPSSCFWHSNSNKQSEKPMRLSCPGSGWVTVTVFLIKASFYACSLGLRNIAWEDDLFRKGERRKGYRKLARVLIQAETPLPSLPSERSQPGEAHLCSPPIGLKFLCATVLPGIDECFTSANHFLCTVVLQYPRGIGSGTPRQVPKSMDVQVFYVKWHSICI